MGRVPDAHTSDLFASIGVVKDSKKEGDTTTAQQHRRDALSTLLLLLLLLLACLLTWVCSDERSAGFWEVGARLSQRRACGERKEGKGEEDHLGHLGLNTLGVRGRERERGPTCRLLTTTTTKGRQSERAHSSSFGPAVCHRTHAHTRQAQFFFSQPRSSAAFGGGLLVSICVRPPESPNPNSLSVPLAPQEA